MRTAILEAILYIVLTATYVLKGLISTDTLHISFTIVACTVSLIAVYKEKED